MKLNEIKGFLWRVIKPIAGTYIIVAYIVPFVYNIHGLGFLFYTLSIFGFGLEVLQILAGVISFVSLVADVPLYYIFIPRFRFR